MPYFIIIYITHIHSLGMLILKYKILSNYYMKRWALLFFSTESYIQKAIGTIQLARGKGEWKDDIVLMIPDDFNLDENTKNIFNSLSVIIKSMPNLDNAEAASTDGNLDFLSNGFKPRTADGGFNGSGSTYIYMAFAENPFVTSTQIPVTAR